MPKAAADVVRSILFSAVIDAIEALRAASKGLPNTMLRDLQSIHRNTAFEDLPKEVQDSIALGVRAAFNELSKEGYAVGPREAIQQSRPMAAWARYPKGSRRQWFGKRAARRATAAETLTDAAPSRRGGDVLTDRHR